MLKTDYPSEPFLEYFYDAFDLTVRTGWETTPANLWTQMVMLAINDGTKITDLFTWDPKEHNRIKTIAKVIECNLVPGFVLDSKNLISRISPSQAAQPWD